MAAAALVLFTADNSLAISLTVPDKDALLFVTRLAIELAADVTLATTQAAEATVAA